MKKGFILILLISCLFLITACTENGNLTVFNNTGVTLDIRVDTEYHTLTPGQSKVFTWSLGSSFLGVEEKTVTVLIYRNNSYHTEYTVRIKAGSSETTLLSNYVTFLTGELSIKNEAPRTTEVRVDGTDYTITPGQTRSFQWEFQSAGQRSVGVKYYERLFLFEQNFNETIISGQSKNLNINNTAGGLQINNNSHAFTIREVYISPSTSPTWGNDKLVGTIPPQAFVQWNLAPGLWDIKVVDNWDDEFVAFDQPFTIGVLSEYDYTGFLKVKNAAELKADKATGEASSNARVEMIR